MKNTFRVPALLAVCILLVAGFSAFTFIKKDTPPQIRFTELNFDFGTITAGETVTHDFEYTNTGDQGLKLMKVVTGCECLTSAYSADPLKKGDKAKLTISFNSTGKSGSFVKTILVDNNSPSGAVRLMVKAKIEAAKTDGSGQ